MHAKKLHAKSYKYYPIQYTYMPNVDTCEGYQNKFIIYDETNTPPLLGYEFPQNHPKNSKVTHICEHCQGDKSPQNPPRTSRVTHLCEHCNKPHLVYKSELKRGRGLFCSLSCARQYAHSKPTKTTCTTCGCTFYTRLNRKHCSLECQEET